MNVQETAKFRMTEWGLIACHNASRCKLARRFYLTSEWVTGSHPLTIFNHYETEGVACSNALGGIS